MSDVTFVGSRTAYRGYAIRLSEVPSYSLQQGQSDYRVVNPNGLVFVTESELGRTFGRTPELALEAAYNLIDRRFS